MPQARSNKAANKPDSELNEFETVRVSLSLTHPTLFFFLSLIHFATPTHTHIAFVRKQVLEENRRQGEEDQAFEKRVQGKKAAAKKRATRRSA